ncbi:MAG: phosphoribosyl-AMP cyclohydrolase [Planctomycetes bacterium]|nr:phosphoribosyl-AMP cyclohydrolase [Planctomycetota bacterium]
MELLKHLQFNNEGHIPAIIFEASLKQVLTLCYMTEEALRKTIETGKVHVFRRSMGRLMIKGETSGHIQIVKGIYPDCEGKSLVIEVEQKVAGCHKGYMSCYYRRYDPETGELKTIAEKVFDPEKTYG